MASGVRGFSGLASAVLVCAMCSSGCASAPPSPPPQAASGPTARPTAGLPGRSASGLTGRPAPPGTPPANAPSADCRAGDPLANVYHPERLDVMDPCKSVAGTVALVRHEQDGDLHIDLRPDPGEVSLLNDVNRREQHGALVLEVVPADQAGCVPGRPPVLPPTARRGRGYDYGTCTGAAEQPPAPGAHVSVTGPYVLDRAHGWMEIHPVWSIRVLQAGRGAG